MALVHKSESNASKDAIASIPLVTHQRAGQALPTYPRVVSSSQRAWHAAVQTRQQYTDAPTRSPWFPVGILRQAFARE